MSCATLTHRVACSICDGLLGPSPRVRKSRNVKSLRSEKHGAFGTGSIVTRHPRMGAVAQPAVAVRERVWNEQRTGTGRENAGVYRLLCVNVCGIRQLRGKTLFGSCCA
jgi:hypothetical protein